MSAMVEKKNRDYDERIAELQEKQKQLQEKQKQLKEQEKILKARKSQQERKERTKHLIEIGGAVYSVLGRSYQDGDINRLIAFLKGQELRGNFFSSAMNSIDKNE